MSELETDDALALHGNLTVIDAHCDILMDVTNGHCRLADRVPVDGVTSGRVRGQVDIPRLREGGVTAQVLTVFVEERYHDNPSRRALDMIATCHEEVQANTNAVLLVRRPEDIRRAKCEKKIAFILGLEGAEPLGTDIALVRVFYELGVRLIGLTWNWRNAAADGWDASGPLGGLTPFGRHVVREMCRLGMIVDIAHLAKPGFWDVIEAAEQPIIGSHCRTWGDWHSLDDEQLRAVAARGGVVCAIGVRRPDLADIVNQIQHIADVAGINHAGFGADFYGLDLAPVGMEDATKYPALTAALLQRGFYPGDVAKIMGGNLLRVFDEVLR